jgi:hypothetical protein
MAKSNLARWTKKHLLGLEDMTAKEILAVLDLADVERNQMCPVGVQRVRVEVVPHGLLRHDGAVGGRSLLHPLL